MVGPIARPAPGDVAVAGGLLAAALVEALITHTTNGPTALVVATSVATTVPLLWRRTHPGWAVLGAIIGALLPVLLGSHADGLVILAAGLVALHAVNAYGTWRLALVGSLALFGSYVAEILAANDGAAASSIVWTAAICALAAGAGQLMASQSRSNRAAVAAAEREAVAAERRAVAADLHDVIAHGLALMVVQAGAAAEIVNTDPAHARRLLEGVQTSGEHAAAELANLLAVLSPGSADTGPGPTPGLLEVPALVQEVRAGGARIRLTVVGDPTRVPEGLSHAAYRIVQEALTNAIKHAPGAEVNTDIRTDTQRLGIVVENRGPADNRARSTASGHGLSAMRERVALFGGTMEAAPTAEGWRTSASFPLDAAGVEFA